MSRTRSMLSALILFSVFSSVSFNCNGTTPASDPPNPPGPPKLKSFAPTKEQPPSSAVFVGSEQEEIWVSTKGNYKADPSEGIYDEELVTVLSRGEFANASFTEPGRKIFHEGLLARSSFIRKSAAYTVTRPGGNNSPKEYMAKD